MKVLGWLVPDQERGGLFGVLTDTHIPHMNAQYSVSELFFIDLFFQDLSIYVTWN